MMGEIMITLDLILVKKEIVLIFFNDNIYL
jgi:hypothetical protein